MRLLGNDESLQSLIGRLSNDLLTKANFEKLIRFLKESKYWDEIDRYYSVSRYDTNTMQRADRGMY